MIAEWSYEFPTIESEHLLHIWHVLTTDLGIPPKFFPLNSYKDSKKGIMSNQKVIK